MEQQRRYVDTPPPRVLLLGSRLFSIGGSRLFVAIAGLVALGCAIGGGWLLARHVATSEQPWGGGSFRPFSPEFIGLVLLLFAASAASFAWRESRGIVVIWSGGIELRWGRRASIELWGNVAAWRRAGIGDVVLRLRKQPILVAIECGDPERRDVVIQRLIAADVPQDPWLDDPRRLR